MDKEEIQKKIAEEDDFIHSKKYKNSIDILRAQNPNGVDDTVVGRVLGISEEKAKEIYAEAVEMLKKDMKE